MSGRDELVARYHRPLTVADATTVTVGEPGGAPLDVPAPPGAGRSVIEGRWPVGPAGEVEVCVATWPRSAEIPAGLLHPREAQVVAALFDGLRPAGIAERHGVGVKTVRKQLSSAYAKLGVSGQAELVATYRP